MALGVVLAGAVSHFHRVGSIRGEVAKPITRQPNPTLAPFMGAKGRCSTIPPWCPASAAAVPPREDTRRTP